MVDVAAVSVTGAIEISSAFTDGQVGDHAVQVGGVVDLADQAGDAVARVVEGEVVEERAQDPSARPVP